MGKPETRAGVSLAVLVPLLVGQSLTRASHPQPLSCSRGVFLVGAACVGCRTGGWGPLDGFTVW